MNQRLKKVVALAGSRTATALVAYAILMALASLIPIGRVVDPVVRAIVDGHPHRRCIQCQARFQQAP